MPRWFTEYLQNLDRAKNGELVHWISEEYECVADDMIAALREGE